MDVSASGAMKLRCADYCRCSAMANPTAQTTSASICPLAQTRASEITSSWWWFSWFSLWYFTWCDRRPCADETIWIRRCRHPTMAPTTDHLHRPSTDAFTVKSSVVFVPLKIVIKLFHKSDPSLAHHYECYCNNVQCLFSIMEFGSKLSRAKTAERFRACRTNRFCLSFLLTSY